MPEATRELQATLDELDRFIQTEHPQLYERFRPGLSDGEIERLAASLLPYYLPAELVTLYRWHGGWDAFAEGDYVSLLADASFHPLADVISNYRVWLEALGNDGWHPLWFPAFGDQSGELVSLQLEPGLPAGQVYSFHAEMDLGTSYDSVATLFSATLELWRGGFLPPRDMLYLTPELRQLVALHNPRSRRPDGSERREISRFGTTDWPVAWKAVLGLAPLAPAADELVVTIAELRANPSCGRPIRAALRGRGGTFDSFFYTASDETGEVEVLIERDATQNFREGGTAERYDLWLVPLEQLRDAAAVPTPSFLATRIVPL
jgi:cell wall assembly regulator SMI1